VAAAHNHTADGQALDSNAAPGATQEVKVKQEALIGHQASSVGAAAAAAAPAAPAVDPPHETDTGDGGVVFVKEVSAMDREAVARSTAVDLERGAPAEAAANSSTGPYPVMVPVGNSTGGISSGKLLKSAYELAREDRIRRCVRERCVLVLWGVWGSGKDIGAGDTHRWRPAPTETRI
jgi:hypothetical protein